MKKILVIALAALALSFSAAAQRASVPYVGLGGVGNFNEKDFGAVVVGGFRNYNRNSLVSFTYGAEALVYLFPSATTTFGAFAIPEIGVAIGPKGFKLFPHTGIMLGYDTQTKSFGWGGKSGFAFDFGRCVTIDFCTYIPRYNFAATTWGATFIWRFGK